MRNDLYVQYNYCNVGLFNINQLFQRSVDSNICGQQFKIWKHCCSKNIRQRFFLPSLILVFGFIYQHMSSIHHP